VAALHIFLIRHGETALNAAGVLRGQIDVPLNETGEAEAVALGGAFREVPLSAVVSSPLTRAVETARPVATAARAPLSTDEHLSDRFYGELAGHSLEQVEKRFGSIDAAPLVEAWQLLEARAEEAFFDAAASLGAARPRSRAGAIGPGAPELAHGDRSTDGAGTVGGQAPSVALVTHDAVIRALLKLLVPALGSVKLELPTGSWSELVADTAKGQWSAVRLGELPANGSRP
jgi:probable phosphoglycerate mutase